MSAAGLTATNHYRRADERPFLAGQRADTTILFGTLTTKHDALIRVVFQRSGYRCENLPIPNRAAHEVGKEFCNNGLCNPNYFTAGNLIQYLRRVQAETGVNQEEVVNRFLYFTAGGCGPCRFGMYESEYKLAADNAGFKGFRVLTFNSNKVIHEGSEQPGLAFTMDFGMGMLNALLFGDILYETAYQMRPYEVVAGSTDKAIADCLERMCEFLRTRKHFHVLEVAPPWLRGWLRGHDKWKRFADNWGKYFAHLYSKDYLDLLAWCRRRLNEVEVDRTRLKPRVKIVGEFFSQIAEGEANYDVFRFLEREGAEVVVDSLTSLLLYWLHQSRMHGDLRKRVHGTSSKKDWMIKVGARAYRHQFERVSGKLGGLTARQTPQEEYARLAAPWYDPLARGGEGHLEVAKSIYYTIHNKAHMILSLKPFGCMPSTQSDGVMARIAAKHSEMVFLPIETAADGEINALSRVQMALGDARRKARAEFDAALKSTGCTLEEIQEWVSKHPEVRKPFYHFGEPKGIAGTAARFILHVGVRVKRTLARGGRK
jgi:predicted nucleotide-binding protein (sugar kinase/HSP70/actin superfamily)